MHPLVILTLIESFLIPISSVPRSLIVEMEEVDDGLFTELQQVEAGIDALELQPSTEWISEDVEDQASASSIEHLDVEDIACDLLQSTASTSSHFEHKQWCTFEDMHAFMKTHAAARGFKVVHRSKDSQYLDEHQRPIESKYEDSSSPSSASSCSMSSSSSSDPSSPSLSSHSSSSSSPMQRKKYFIRGLFTCEFNKDEAPKASKDESTAQIVRVSAVQKKIAEYCGKEGMICEWRVLYGYIKTSRIYHISNCENVGEHLGHKMRHIPLSGARITIESLKEVSSDMFAMLQKYVLLGLEFRQIHQVRTMDVWFSVPLTSHVRILPRMSLMYITYVLWYIGRPFLVL